MQDMPRVQDDGFVVEWQLAVDPADGEGHRLIDLSAERPAIILPEDSPVRTS
jgi:hypothetical protein